MLMKWNGPAILDGQWRWFGDGNFGSSNRCREQASHVLNVGHGRNTDSSPPSFSERLEQGLSFSAR